MQVVEPQHWVEAVRTAVSGGHAQFVTLMGIDVDGAVQLWLRLRGADGPDLVLATGASTAVPSITSVLPEADWYEREAAELFDIDFVGRVTTPLLLVEGSAGAMRKDRLLATRQSTPWPGEKDPGGTTPRRRTLPPGVAGGVR